MTINPNLGQIPAFQSTPATRENDQESAHDSSAKNPNSSSSSSSTMDSSQLEKQATAQLQSQIRAQSVLAETQHAPIAELHETKNAAEFQTAIAAAKNDGKQDDIDKGTFGTKDSKWYGASVHVYKVEEYEKMTMLLTSDKKGGVATKPEGDIVSVFKHPKSTAKNLIGVVIPQAINHGGTHLDCFAGALPQMYAKYGFIPVAKVQFDDNFKPEDWNIARDGRPDIVFMVYEPKNSNQQDEKLRELGPKVKKAIEELPYSTYEDAAATQRAFVEEIKERTK
jgi:hypothetical protein